MLKTALLATCATLALTGLAAAQATQPAAPAQPATPPAATAPAATPPATVTSPARPAQPAAGAARTTVEPGIRAVDPTAVKMVFYTVRPADMLASTLMDLDVHNLQNEEIGEIEDLIIDEGKNIRGVVLSVGGFLGIGERRVAIEPSSLVITREGADNLKAVVNTTKDELRNATEFKYEANLARR